MAHCYRHPDRETGVSCSNCERPICPECMTPTSVGMRCPDCARQRTQVRRVSGPSWGPAPGWSATQVLIAINIAVFLAEVATGVTLGGGDGGWVYDQGALYGPLIAGHGVHQYWRLLTSGFLHEGLIHIAFNMFFLWMIGRVIEPLTGRGVLIALYLAAVFAGSFGALLFQPDIPTVGASAGCFGLFGVYAVLTTKRGIGIWDSGVGITLVLNLVFDLTIQGISIGGHIAGFCAGVLGGLAVHEYMERRHRPAWVYASCVIIACVSIVAAILASTGTGLTPNGFTI